MIKITNLSKHYNERIIFENVNLEIPDGAFVALSGESGSGKSTFLNIIGGLEKPTSGEIIINENKVNSLSGKQRTDFYRKTIGIIFQGSYLEPQLTLKENIALPGVFAGLKKKDRENKISMLASRLGILERLSQLPRESSGGEVERAAIARALLLNPKIILADEPTANLDLKNSKNVLTILRNLCQELNITVIISSHDPVVFEFATEKLAIENKTIREF